jgi:hypothetical protein
MKRCGRAEYVDWRTCFRLRIVQGSGMMGFCLGKACRRQHALWCAALLNICVGGLTGCSEIAFKRGSGPDAFAADREACQARDKDPAAVHACLSEAGWHVAEADPAQAIAAPAPVAQAPASSQASAPSQTLASLQAAPPPQPVPARPEAKTVIVGGWWKFGGGAADLQFAVAACVAGLGPASAPDVGYHTVTPTLYACLRASGWHGVARPGG